MITATILFFILSFRIKLLTKLKKEINIFKKQNPDVYVLISEMAKTATEAHTITT